VSAARLADGARVLVRAPDWLGDFVMAEPVLRAVARRPGPPPTFVAEARFLDLLDERYARVNCVDPGDHAAWRGHDVALLLTGSFRSAWTAWRARIPVRVGQARDARSLLLTDAVRPALERGGTPLGLGRPGRWPRVLPRPFGASALELALRLGLSVSDPRPRLVPRESARRRAAGRLAAAGIAPGAPFVLCNAGGRADSAKAYPGELWGGLLDELEARLGLPLALVCGPGEEAALAVARAAARRARPLALPEAGPVELPELLALCAAAALVVTADSGPRHLAQAAGTPLVVACGPTDPRHTADGTRATRIARMEVECGPCHRERCPLAGDAHHACMRRLEPARLAALAADLYHAAPRAP
jgi:heptosyltransferase-2